MQKKKHTNLTDQYKMAEEHEANNLHYRVLFVLGY